MWHKIVWSLNEYINESNGNKYLTLVTTNESKDTLKKSEELWSKIRDFFRVISNNSVNHDGKYIKITFQSDDDLHLKKTLGFQNIIIVIGSIFHEGNK